MPPGATMRPGTGKWAARIVTSASACFSTKARRVLRARGPSLQKRLVLVQQILKKLEEDAARPMMGWRFDYHAQWP